MEVCSLGSMLNIFSWDLDPNLANKSEFPQTDTLGSSFLNSNSNSHQQMILIF